MPATVLIREKNGAGETATDKTGGTVRFKNADNATVDLVNPLIKPTTNREYSFEKWLRVNFSVAPDTQITDIEAYMDGTNNYGTGRKLWTRAVASYSTPGVPTETLDPPEIPVNGTPVAATDAFSFTSGAPLALGAGPHTGTGDKGSYMILVVEIETTSASGTLPAETLTIRYDEI